MLKLGTLLQGGKEEVSDEAMEARCLDHAFDKCVSKCKSRATGEVSYS